MAKRSFRSRELGTQPAYPTLERYDALVARRGFLALLGAGAFGALVGCDGSESGAAKRYPSRLDLQRDLTDAGPGDGRARLEGLSGLPDAPTALVDQAPPPTRDGPHVSARHDPKPRRPPFARRVRDGGDR